MKTFFFFLESTCALCPWSLALASSIPVLGLESVCPRKGCPWPWPWPRIFFVSLALALASSLVSSTPPLMPSQDGSTKDGMAEYYGRIECQARMAERCGTLRICLLRTSNLEPYTSVRYFSSIFEAYRSYVRYFVGLFFCILYLQSIQFNNDPLMTYAIYMLTCFCLNLILNTF